MVTNHMFQQPTPGLHSKLGGLAYCPSGVPEARWDKAVSVNTLTFKSVTLSARREQRLLTPERHCGLPVEAAVCSAELRLKPRTAGTVLGTSS